jgi:16S rRNA (guanine527-N7)-methyltransferase
MPASAKELLGDRAARLSPYAALLAGPAAADGLLGPREVPRLWERHLLNCGAVVDDLPMGADILDIGSGAGLPGLVWALLRPDLHLVLVEPLLRRAGFLRSAAAALGLADVEVVRARAEELVGRHEADVVAARAVAPLARLAASCLPLVRPSGEMWALKGQGAAREVAEAGMALQRGGASNVRIATYGETVLQPPTTLVRVQVSSVPGLFEEGRSGQ